MGPALRKKIKAIEANANILRVVLPLKVVEMTQRNEENKHIHRSHGLGYSSKPQNFGDGLTPIFFNYRIKGTGEEPW